MIKRLKIKNFQCHGDLELEFDEGINIISGASDRGKSAVLRAIDLVRENRPSGFAYRYDPRILKRSKKALKENELTSVEITLNDDNVIARERNKREINQYRVNNIVLQAMRSGVPSEVSSLLNIANHSVQSQHNPYFLLNDSDGEVSRQINELVGLEVINKVLKKASSIVDDAKAKEKEATAEIESISLALEKLKDIDPIEKRFESLNKQVEEEERLSVSIDTLSDLIDNIHDLSSELNLYSAYLSNEKRIVSFNEKIARLNALESSISALELFIDDLNDYSNESEYCENLTQYEEVVNLLNNKIEEYSLLSKSSSELENLIEWFSESETDLQDTISGIKKRTESYIEMLKKAKRCPTCGSTIDEQNIGRIL